MNQRFEELKRRAVAEADTNHIDFDNMSPTDIRMLGDIAVEKKFAELIVRECATRLRETDYELMFTEDGMCDPSISDAMIVAASDIEEYFGVDNGE